MNLTSRYPFLNTTSRYQGFFKYADSFPADPLPDAADNPGRKNIQQKPPKKTPGAIDDFSVPVPPPPPKGSLGAKKSQAPNPQPAESETEFIQNVLTMLREDMRIEGQMRDDEIDSVIGNLGQASKSEVFYRLEQIMP